MLSALQTSLDSSTRIYNSLPSSVKPAFFQLVHHPAQATLTLAAMWVSAGINNLRASQARISANDYMTQVEQLFEDDYALELDYHGLLEGKLPLSLTNWNRRSTHDYQMIRIGKWDHMMDQTHVMYYYWQNPMANTYVAV